MSLTGEGLDAFGGHGSDRRAKALCHARRPLVRLLLVPRAGTTAAQAVTREVKPRWRLQALGHIAL